MKVGVMASIKYTYNWNGVFAKLKVVVMFFKYTKMASIQLTLFKLSQNILSYSLCLVQQMLMFVRTWLKT
jgi:hypothetical protein